MDTKTCTKCGEIKLRGEFNKSKRGGDGFAAECRACRKKYYRAYLATEAGRKISRETHVKSFYGLSGEDYRDLLEKHTVCAICGAPPPEGGYLHVDHNHSTGVVRGLLCNSCNPGLGLFKDDPDRLRAAALYLEEHSED